MDKAVQLNAWESFPESSAECNPLIENLGSKSYLRRTLVKLSMHKLNYLILSSQQA